MLEKGGALLSHLLGLKKYAVSNIFRIQEYITTKYIYGILFLPRELLLYISLFLAVKAAVGAKAGM